MGGSFAKAQKKDQAGAGPAAKGPGGAGADADSGTAVIRRRFIGGTAEAELAAEELGQALQAGGKIDARAIAVLGHLNGIVIELMPSLAALDATEMAKVKPLAEVMVGKASVIYALAPEAGAPLYHAMQAGLGQIMGGIDIHGVLARPTGVDAGERQGSALAELDAAHAALAATVAAIDPLAGGEPSGDLGLAQLARATVLLRNVPDKEPLLGPVREMSSLAARLPDGDRKNELMIRLSDVRQALGLERLTTSKMEDKLAGEGKKKVAPAQREAFGNALDQVHAHISDSFEFRLAAVREILAEVQEVDPPKEPSIWAEIAIAALTAAATALTMGLGGLVVGQVAGKVLGKAAVKVTEAIGDKLLEVGKETIKAAVEKGIEAKVKGAKPEVERPEAEGGETKVAGGSASTSFKAQFFSFQEGALVEGRAETLEPAMARLRQFEAHLDEDPQGLVDAAHTLATQTTYKREEVVEKQRAESRVGYVKALAVAATTETVARLEFENGVPKVKKEDKNTLGKGIETGKTGFKDNLPGLINLGFVLNPFDASEKVKLVEAWAYGLNSALCGQIAEMNLLQAGIPLRARSEGANQFVSLGRDQGAGYVATADDQFEGWLAAKGGGEAGDEMAYKKAAQIIFEQELFAKPTLKQMEIKLEAK